MDVERVRVMKELLYEYLTYSFQPVFPEEKRKAWVRWFVLYWVGKISRVELKYVCNIGERLNDCFTIFLDIGE